MGDGLGRILFDRNKRWPLGVVIPAYCVALGVAAFGICVLAEAALRPCERGLIAIGVFLAVIGLLVAVVTYCSRVNLFRVHALGVTRSTTLGTRIFHCDNVGKFTWWAVRQFVNGLYTGTTLKIALEPLAGTRVQRHQQRIMCSSVQITLGEGPGSLQPTRPTRRPRGQTETSVLCPRSLRSPFDSTLATGGIFDSAGIGRPVLDAV